MRIEADGFKSWEQTGLVLQVGETRTIAPVLEVGAVSTEVTVSASEATVDLVTAKTESVISEVTLDRKSVV